jgi:hypothetical protein
LFGVSDLNTLDEPLPLPKTGPPHKDNKYDSFADAVETLRTVTLARRYWGAMWPLREFFNDASANANRTVDDWVEPLIHRAMDAKRKRGNDKGSLSEGSFLDHLADSTDDVRLIRDEVPFPLV